MSFVKVLCDWLSLSRGMMDSLNVLLTKRFVNSDIDYLRSSVDGLDFFQPCWSDESALFEYINSIGVGIDVVMGPPPPKNILVNLKKTLKYIQIPWAGVDSIQLSDCRELEIPVANSHGNSTSVAEMAVALLLSIAKLIPFHDAELRKGRWHRPNSSDGFYPPKRIHGVTVGFFGYGAINKSISKLVQGFGVKTIACSNSLVDVEYVDESYLVDDGFFEFLKKADYVIIAAPLTDKTRFLFNSKAFKAMKKSSYLINVSRGGIVCDASLFTALIEKQIAGAAIDTWNVSPPGNDTSKSVSTYNFDELDNVVMSPHRAGFIEEELPHLIDVVDNFRRLKLGRPLINLIDFNKGY